MGHPTKFGNWLPAAWVGLAAVLLGADYFSGPFISVSILFVIPVVLASRFSGGRWGIALGVLMPSVHLGFHLHENSLRPLTDSLLNAGIRIAALVAFAILIDRVSRQAREIRVLRGLLPVCAFCKKIRNEDQAWQPIESFITERSEASFTHTVCPECAKQHYGEYFEKIKARQSGATPDSPELPV